MRNIENKEIAGHVMSCKCGGTTFNRIFGLLEAEVVVFVPDAGVSVSPEDIETVKLYCPCGEEYITEIIAYEFVGIEAEGE